MHKKHSVYGALASSSAPVKAKRPGTRLSGVACSSWVGSKGRNVRFDSRFGTAVSPELVSKSAAELLALSPDVILAGGSPNVAALQQANRNVPIVFAGVIDPVGGGLVQSLARPGGNTTGFIGYEYGLSVKWLELLKEIAPNVTRVGVIREAANTVGIGLWAAMQGAAPSLKVELSPIDVRDANDIERLIATFAGGGPSGGLIVAATGLTLINRDLISGLAARHRLPAVYSQRIFVTGGGLISYGPDQVDVFQRAAGTLTASCAVSSQPTCQCRRRPNMNC